MPAAIREDPRALENFLREARIAASLQHPNIVTIYDAGQTADEVYITMEYLEGRSLQEILDEVSCLPLANALGVFRQTCLGLIHAHKQNIVHRDVKPANMMLTAAGSWLMDSAWRRWSRRPQVTSVRGTFAMALNRSQARHSG
jgi:serine/threonine-protein kinase